MLRLERPYQAVLFDMDGTLVDSSAVVERTWRAWAVVHGVDFAHLMESSHGRRSIDTVREFAPPGMDIEAENRKIEAQEISDTDGIVPVPGAAELLARLPADRWAVVTSASRELAITRLTAAGLPLPGTLVTAENVVRGKPDPEGYLLAARLLGTTAEQCLVFEDAPAGLEAGQRAGCDVVAITAARPLPFTASCPAVRDYTQLQFELV